MSHVCEDIEMQANPSLTSRPRQATSHTLVDDSERQGPPSFTFSDDVWQDVDLQTVRGSLAYAKFKDSDWAQANYRIHGPYCALVLNRLSTNIKELERKTKGLITEAERADPKEVPEELNEKIDQLIEVGAVKFQTYYELLLQYRKVKDLEVPSRRHLIQQQAFEAQRVLAPGMPGDFSDDSPQDEYRSLFRRDPLLIWSDGLGCISHNLASFFTRGSRDSGSDDGILDQMSRRTLNPYAFALIVLTLVLLFVAPMPISLFKVLSVQSTFVLLVVFELLFTAFFLTSFRLNCEVLLAVSIAYGGLMWSSASNWISIE